ncbi:MAG: glycosyltransferase family 4 protein [Clostridiales bacterium]|nr:glycosyltransferase family 4 protein [Clostridiales bacterium]
MSKRILMISYFFAPENTIGAVRPTKLAKYLQRQGHEVTVLCGDGMWGLDDPTLERDLQELRDVHILREWNPVRDRYEKKAAMASEAKVQNDSGPVRGKSSWIGRQFRRLKDAVYIYLTVISDRHFQWLGCKELKKLTGQYDAVFSTYSPLSVHMIARKAKKTGLAAKWIADCRDEVEVPFVWMRPWMRWYTKMMRREADILCGVSKGLLETLRFGDVGRVLTNGFDRDDLTLTDASEGKNERFSLAYCGQLRMGRKEMGSRDLTPIFQALRQLVDDGTLEPGEIDILYAGDEGQTLRKQAEAAGLGQCVTDYGMVTRERSLQVLRKADVLLMATWSIPGQTGILSGKLFECMLVKKPVVCAVQGTVANSEMSQVIRETQLGYCIEEAKGYDLSGLADYLRPMVASWRRGEAGVQTDKSERYHYDTLARQLASWVEE